MAFDARVNADAVTGAELIDGRLNLYCWISDSLTWENEDLHHELLMWDQGDNESCISLNFTLQELVEYQIDGHRIDVTGELDADSRPLFEAIRAECVAAIALIDGLKFEGEAS